jgi:hypothetical protein
VPEAAEGSGEPAEASAPKDKKKGKKKKRKVVVQEVVPTWARVAGAVAVLLVVLLAVTTYTQRNHADDLRSAARDRTAAERVAGEFAETLFTFDGAHPTASLDRLKQLATSAYQPKVDEARQTALAGGSQGQTQANMTAHVTDVYLTELAGSQAHAVTRADWVLNASGQTLALDLYLRIDLKREGGSWKVDAVTALTAKEPQSATTSTTTPGATPTTAPVTTTTAGH